MSAQRELGGHTRSQRQHPQTWREPPRQVPEPRGRGPDIAGGVWTVRCELHITGVHPQVCAASPLCAFIYQIIIQPLFTYSVPSCHRAPPPPMLSHPPLSLPPKPALSWGWTAVFPPALASTDVFGFQTEESHFQLWAGPERQGRVLPPPQIPASPQGDTQAAPPPGKSSGSRGGTGCVGSDLAGRKVREGCWRPQKG